MVLRSLADRYHCRLSIQHKGNSGKGKYSKPVRTFRLPQWLASNPHAPLGHFADHPLEDIIEKIACQFTARHIRGRPRPPFWYPGWPLYVCDSRYNDRERVFVRIKNWNSCVPEEVRKSEEFMPIYPFERTVFPRRFGSPFFGKGAVKGPGGIGHSVERVEGEKAEGGREGKGLGEPRVVMDLARGCMWDQEPMARIRLAFIRSSISRRISRNKYSHIIGGNLSLRIGPSLALRVE